MRISNLCAYALITLSLPALAEANPKAPQNPAPRVTEEAKTSGAPKATTLGTMTTEVEGDLTIVTARLNKIPDWKEVPLEEHGTFLQIKMPKTQIPASGEFVDGNGPFLKKIATFQLPEDDGALRLFLNIDAAKAKLATTAELLGDRLIITIDHKKIEQLIAPQTARQDSPTAADIIAKTEVAKDQVAPSELISKTSKVNDKNVASFDGKLNEQLIKVAGFCAVLFMGLIAVHLSKSRRRSKRQAKFEEDHMEPASMRVLSSITLGQKQKLTLVKVGNQQLLLGVTGDSINLITTIDTKPKQSAFSRQLESANPNAEIRLKSAEEITTPRSQRRISTTAPSKIETPVKGGRINVGVGEDGPREMTMLSSKKDDDITRILRDRLRNIPPG